MGEGIHPMAENVTWFKWDTVRQHWKLAPKPTFSEQIVNWSIG